MKRRCLTLIELLVVIAVIAFLLAILIPVQNGIRQHARALACSSRIRTLTIDLIMHETKNQAFPCSYQFIRDPPPGGYPGSGGYDKIGWWWFNFMEGYEDYEKKMALRCPSKLLRHPDLTSNLLYGNYGVNRSICKSPDDIRKYKEDFVGAPLGRSDIPQPSRTLLIVDSGFSIISWWHATDEPPIPFNGNRGEDIGYVPGLKINKDRKLLPGQEQDAIDGRHPNKTVNVGFADGHIARKIADDLLVEKQDDDYTNRSPLWSPE